MRAFQLSRWTYPAVGNPEYYWRRALDNRWIAVGDPFVIQLANDDRWCLVETRRCTSEGGRDLFAEALASTIEAFMVRAPALPAASKAAPQRLDLPRAWSVRGVGLNKELLATPVAAGDASRFAVKLESERPPNRPKPPPGTFGANLQHPSLSLNATFTLNSGGALVEVQTEHEYTLEGTTRSHVYHWRRLRHRSPTPDALEDYELPPAPEGLGKPGASAQPACSCPQKDIKCAMTCASGQRPPASQPPLPPHLDLPDPGEPPRLYFPSAEEANERSLSSPLYVLPRL
jgi:hypothetical protein